MELDKICRLCLTTKKDMRNLFQDNLVNMIEEISNSMKVENNPGWPEKICVQCLHQVSRSHSFKKRIEKADEQLRLYIKSLTVIVDEPQIKEMRVPEIKQHQIQQQHQPQIQEIQIQRPEAHPLIIAMNNQPTMVNSGQHQLIQTANGQIIQAQIGQFIQGPNNTIQMITASPSVNQQPQLLQLRSEPENRCELIVQPQEMNDSHYFDEIPFVVQSANGQQTILNLPHHQIQALQAQIAQSAGHQQQQHQQVQIQQMTTSSQPTVVNTESNEIEVHEVHEIQDGDYEQMDEENYICQDMEEVLEDADESTTYIVETLQEDDSSENSDMDDKLLNDFLAQQTHSQPGKHVCNLCSQEFKHVKWLNSHMKSIHINWIKANCKKQPQCSICHKSFRGPGMLKMHMKTHEKENKLPTCTVCSKEFKSKSILYRHRATHFNNQKEHRCTICDKTFSSAYQLNAHVQRHQKNLQCKHCDKTFTTTLALKNHVQQQHEDGDKEPAESKS